MFLLTIALVVALSWWFVHLLELGYVKKDNFYFFAASLVAVMIGAFFVVHQLLGNFFTHLPY